MIRRGNTKGAGSATRAAMAFTLCACVQVLDIEPAKVDPTFDPELPDATQLNSGGQCLHFDNARVTSRGTDGKLRPLPE
jgi:hypothetical protein